MLSKIIELLEKEDPNRILPIGFHKPHSYRGYYEDLAFEVATDISVGTMLELCRESVGKTFYGYKGGEYVMNEYTDCWIAEYGRSNGQSIGSLLMPFLLGKSSEQIKQELLRT